jgi:hypothetical protein
MISIYRNKILPVVLCRSETWSGEHGLRAFENEVLRRKLGIKREETMGGWRILHSEKFHNLYPSPIGL